jgi:O-antigen/teichoic acid export membrane protein
MSKRAGQDMRLDLEPTTRAMARGAAVNLGGAMLANVLALAFNFVITHVVSAGRFGLLSIGLTVVSLATIPALLGLETGTVRFVALGAGKKDERAAAGAQQVSLLLATAASAVLMVAILVLAPWISDSFFHKPDAAGLMRLVAISLPALTLGRVIVAGIQGYGIMTYSAWLGPLRNVVNLVTAVPLLAVGLGARGLAIAGDITAWVITAIAIAFLIKVHPRVLDMRGTPKEFGRILRFSLPQTMTAMLFFTIVWTDTLLVGRFRTAAEVGVYTIVGRLLTPATLVSTAVGQMFAPRIAAHDARGDRKTLAVMLKRVTYWNTAVSIPFFTMLIVGATPLLALFGPKYKTGAVALAILSAGQLINTAAGPLGQLINLSGRPYITLMNNGLVAAINIGVCLVLIPRYGLAGAATGTATALTLVNAIKLVEVKYLFKMSPFRMDSARAFAAAAISSLCALPLVLAVPWPSTVVEVLVVTAVLFLVYARLTFLFGMSDEDKQLFDAGIARFKRRRPVTATAVRGEVGA